MSGYKYEKNKVEYNVHDVKKGCKLKSLTYRRSIRIFGRAAWYIMKSILTPIPRNVPAGMPNIKHAMKHAKAGIKSLPND